MKKISDYINTIKEKCFSVINNNKKIIFISIITFMFGSIFSPFFSKFIEHYSTKYFSTKKLSYEISSISRHEKYELSESAKIEKFNSFNLDLDDNIIKNYFLIKINIKNQGISIETPLKFRVQFENNKVKIIDIKHKIIAPTNKFFRIIHNLPHLTWSIDGYNSTEFSWDLGKQELADYVAGFYVYRSQHKRTGYGRINAKTLTQPMFTIPIEPSKALTVWYYRVTAVSKSGEENDLSDDFIQSPDFLALLPFFKGVYWIDPNKPTEKDMSGSPAAPFHSLSEAIARVGKSATFLLMQNRDQVTSSENLSKEAIVFYKDDLDFLRGIAEVSIPTGIDEGSNIQLLFLCKVIYEKKIDVKIDLQESPDIKFDKIKNRLHDDIYIKQEIHIDDKQKSFLTPFKIQAYMGQNTIFLVWEKPKSPKYKGVRIFRSVQKGIDHQTHPGEELYDGPGDTHKLRCKFTYRTPEAPPASFHKQMADSEPPPRKGELIPAAPSGLRISGFESEITGDKLSYYADISVSPDIAYIYTIWTYSDNNTYGYPITINVSLSDASSESTCYQEQGKPDGTK